MPPRRIWFDGIPVCSAMMRVAKLLGGHFQREEADNPAIDGAGVAVRLDFSTPGLGDVVADVRCKGRFSHAGTACKDDQVGLLQTAHHAVEIVKASGDAGQLSIALEGVRGHVDGRSQCLCETLEAPVISTRLGQLVEPSFGIFDLIARGEVDRRVVSDIHHVFANLDQRAAD